MGSLSGSAYLSAQSVGGILVDAMAMEPEQERSAAASYLESESERLALRLATDMIAASVKGLSAPESGDTYTSAVMLADVEADVDRFVEQYKYCSENDLRSPCLENYTSPPLPIDLAGI